MLLCKDCKWFVPEASIVETQCTSPNNSEPNYIDGGTRPRYWSANAVHTNNEMCGPEGRWFVPITGNKFENCTIQSHGHGIDLGSPKDAR